MVQIFIIFCGFIKDYLLKKNFITPNMLYLADPLIVANKIQIKKENIKKKEILKSFFTQRIQTTL